MFKYSTQIRGLRIEFRVEEAAVIGKETKAR
jgi:hypothetical protein